MSGDYERGYADGMRIASLERSRPMTVSAVIWRRADRPDCELPVMGANRDEDGLRLYVTVPGPLVPRRQFEYRVVDPHELAQERPRGERLAADLLNSLGADGWQLVATRGVLTSTEEWMLMRELT